MTLAALRASLADELTAAGIQAYPDVPQSFTPPGAVVLSGDPYLEAGDRFGVMVVRFQLFLFVDATPRLADDADELISKAVAALGDYDIEGISGVDAWRIPETNRVFLGAQLILTTEVARKEIG